MAARTNPLLGSQPAAAMENRLWSMRELLADLLLELKQSAQALKEYPNRLRGFYGAARAAETSGNRQKAAEYYNKLVALTAKADSDKKEIQQAKAYLAAR
jgi:hypothetical protein